MSDRNMEAWRILAAQMPEDALEAEVEALCKAYKLLTYHTKDSRRSHRGFPDRVILAPGRGVMFRELKSQAGQASDAQTAWLDGLTSAGVDAGIWRPMDLYTKRIQRELEHLAKRVRVHAGPVIHMQPEPPRIVPVIAEPWIRR